MAKKWFYAVKNGRVPGIYDNWTDAEQQVKGFAEAIYKKFDNLPDAERFMFGKEEQTDVNQGNGYEIYVDGSFDAKKPSHYSCGVVVLKDGVVVHTISKAASGPAAEMRNVAGEILGACMAFEYCFKTGVGRVTVCHDYEGIAAWCEGAWEAKNNFTQKYKAYYDKISEYVDISFVKVKGHSNNKYNDLADSLAKQALDDISCV